VEAVNCHSIDLCTAPSGQVQTYGVSPLRFREIPGTGTKEGWRAVRARTGALPPTQLTGPDMQIDWYQIPAPGGGVDKSDTAPYGASAADPRVDFQPPGYHFPVPRFLYLVRNGSIEGVKVIRTKWLLERAATACTPAQGHVPGQGEALGSPQPHASWGPGPWDLEMLELAIHLEVDGPSFPECRIFMPAGDCIAGQLVDHSQLRQAHNNKCHVFTVQDSGNGATHWILAVAAGFVTTGPGDPLYPNCQWQQYYQRALTVFYDVTNLSTEDPDDEDGTGFTHEMPTLLAAALGPDPDQEPLQYFDPQPPPGTRQPQQASHAFAVRTKTYGTGPTARTYAFVADLLGRILVYDVSYDKLVQQSPATQVPYHAGKPLLFPTLVHRIPNGPVDGWRPNCTDVEIDNDVLYCATGRDGVTLLDITWTNITPTAPGLPVAAVINTPFAAALELRTSALQRRQMWVGATRCGPRLYGRGGE
jgi:hypothetical protein